jgi:hypothetical protein
VTLHQTAWQILSVSLFTLLPVSAWAADSPLAPIRATVMRATAMLKDSAHQGARARQERLDKVREIVLPRFDAQEIAKRTLGIYWRERTEEERQEFIRLFTTLTGPSREHMIPNGTITTVTNMTKDYSYYLMDVGVAYREDIDEVMNILKEVGADLRRDPEFGSDILDDLEVVGVDDFAASQVTIKVRIKTVPIKQWRVDRELRRRIKRAFDTQGIEIPFPHLTLYFGEPKRGTAAPLRVAFDSEHARINQACPSAHEAAGN